MKNKNGILELSQKLALRVAQGENIKLIIGDLENYYNKNEDILVCHYSDDITSEIRSPQVTPDMINEEDMVDAVVPKDILIKMYQETLSEYSKEIRELSDKIAKITAKSEENTKKSAFIPELEDF